MRRNNNGRALVVVAFAMGCYIACCSSGAFVSHNRSYQRQYQRQARGHSTAWQASSSTAGEGGGIFYDGASDFGKQQKDDSKSSSKSNIIVPSSSPPLVAKPNHLYKDIVIVGGGLAGLSAALYVSQMAPDRHVTILERETHDDDNGKQTTTVASLAAAGMLAPQSERLPKGPLLDLCVASRKLYPDFCNLVERLASQDDDDKENVSVGYVASGGFLAPAFAGDAVATWAPPDNAGSATWLDATQVRELEPHLHENVVGGWWFPEDASVDARKLTHGLRAACQAAGVEILSGTAYEVTSLDLQDGTCKGLWLKGNNKYIHTKRVLVANGAWMRQLLPVPIEPHKGQSLSLKMPSDQPPLLKRVLFAQDSYICPKADGRIVVGATVEAGSYDPHVTPAGILHILSHALQLVPGLADLPLEETWVGLRPTTPDKGPILGSTPWNNLFLAGGYWRNGVLLAPKTGQLLACLLAELELDQNDQALLNAFCWDRFTSAEGGAKLAANARYAASMHPIHKRTSGVGVAASVGTELGSYSDATTAKQERERDRQALWNDDNDDALERAAQMGKQDASAFYYYDDDNDDDSDDAENSVGKDEVQNEEQNNVGGETKALPEAGISSLASLNPSITHPFEGSPDAITVSSENVESPTGGKSKEQTAPEKSAEAQQKESEQEPPLTSGKQSELAQVYEKIRNNKRKGIVMPEETPDERPDPGFRIHHVDPDTRQTREVPPYTSPHEFQEMIAKEKEQLAEDDVPLDSTANVAETAPESIAETSSNNDGDSLLDGYQAIQDAYADASEEEVAEASRKARMAARQDFDSDAGVDLDESALPDLTVIPPKANQTEESSSPTREKSDLSDVYERIRTNKASREVEMPKSQPDDRPDPGFRIYRVDAETREKRVVPPYTTPHAFEQMIAAEKEQAEDVVPVVNGDATMAETAETNGQQQSSGAAKEEEEYNEQTFDGYTAIQQANSRGSREEELEAMRAARRKNRMDEESIDIRDIGAQRAEDF